MRIVSILTACALCWACAVTQTQAAPDNPPPPVSNESPKNPLPPATDTSQTTRAGAQEPGTTVKTTTDDDAVFSNGALAVSGSSGSSQTEPAKYSKRNDELDHLSIAGFTLLYLTESERSEVRAKLASGSSRISVDAKVSAIVPSAQGDPEPVPADLVARIPSLRGLAYASGGNGTVIIINPRIHDVVAVIK